MLPIVEKNGWRENPPRASGLETGTAHILIADDEELVRLTLQKILEKADHQVRVVGNGVEAIKYCETNDPDLLITDIVMPDMEGIETITRLRRDKPHMKIIAMSGGGRVGNFDFLEIAKKLGADLALKKPFVPSDVRDAVSKVVNGGVN